MIANRNKAKPFYKNIKQINSKFTNILKLYIYYDYYRSHFVFRFTIKPYSLESENISPVALYNSDIAFFGLFLKIKYEIKISEMIPIKNSVLYGMLELPLPEDLDNLFHLEKGRIVYIEYADNLHLTPALVSLYIKMMNKALLPSKRYIDDNKFKSNAVRLVTGKKRKHSETVILYDKHKEVMAKSENTLQADEALGIIRYEVKYNKKKLTDIANAYEIEHKKPIDNYTLLSNSFSKKILSDTANKLFTLADFHNKYNLGKKIDATGYGNATKEKLLNFITAADKSHSIRNACELNRKPATFKNHLKIFKEADIAPISIPKDEYATKLIRLFKCIENPMKKYNNCTKIA